MTPPDHRCRPPAYRLPPFTLVTYF
ncbi:hypothetical protein NQ314_017649 [Rhamnusium bicolor]|uniref:Uncharacterized protein n=1 Tax=Rhamnusium bicolor TaxID=1586634 RepID=A0AAV8WTZ7_9CUCU|nr:hypothetical protein NQ314_017649 [Rhamnusium bicolor]